MSDRPEVPFPFPAVGADPITGVPVCVHGDDAAACQREHEAGETFRVRDREARRAAYHERERRRAARALDRYIETTFPEVETLGLNGPTVAGDRFIEAVGDYVLSRLQQKADYGASPCRWGADCERTPRCPGCAPSGPPHSTCLETTSRPGGTPTFLCGLDCPPSVGVDA